MTTLELLKKECEELQGQFILTIENKVTRLVGLGTDSEDIYYLLYNGKELSWMSAVCGVIPLKKYLPEGYYRRMVQIARRNEDFVFFEGRQLEEYVESLVRLKGNESFVVPINLTVN